MSFSLEVALALGLIAGAVVGSVFAAQASLRLARRRLERARAAERRARAAERLAELGSMTGGLAHEIKNPLSTINLNAQLLAEAVGDLDIPSGEQDRLLRRLGTLTREVERLRDILQDFLDYAGELRIEAVPQDLNALVQDLADFVLPQAERAGVRLRCDLPDRPVVAKLDEPHLKQALLNLVLNGLQAMAPAGGAKHLGAPVGELILRVSEESEHGEAMAAVHVIDTGPGVPMEKQQSIFQPYVTGKAGGTGLGLPTTRRIAEAHGGSLTLESSEGQGASFRLTVPLPSPPEIATDRAGR